LAARVRARDQALGAGGCPALAGRPPQRHIEQRSCEGVWGAKLPKLFSFFWYSLERKLVSGGPEAQLEADSTGKAVRIPGRPVQFTHIPSNPHSI